MRWKWPFPHRGVHLAAQPQGYSQDIRCREILFACPVTLSIPAECTRLFSASTLCERCFLFWGFSARSRCWHLPNTLCGGTSWWFLLLPKQRESPHAHAPALSPHIDKHCRWQYLHRKCECYPRLGRQSRQSARSRQKKGWLRHTIFRLCTRRVLCEW